MSLYSAPWPLYSCPNGFWQLQVSHSWILPWELREALMSVQTQPSRLWLEIVPRHIAGQSWASPEKIPFSSGLHGCTTYYPLLRRLASFILASFVAVDGEDHPDHLLHPVQMCKFLPPMRFLGQPLWVLLLFLRYKVYQIKCKSLKSPIW